MKWVKRREVVDMRVKKAGTSLKNKYSFQHTAVKQIDGMFDAKKYVCFLGSCGIGKTHIIAYFTRKVVDRGSRVLIIAGHQNDLKSQFTSRLLSIGIFDERELVAVGTGGVSAKDLKKSHKVLVTIPNAIYRDSSLDSLGKIDYIVIDEAHINVDVHETGMIPRLLRRYPKSKILLVTATGYDLIRSNEFNKNNENVGVIDEYDHNFAVERGVVHPVELNLQKFEFDLPSAAREKDGELTAAGRNALRAAFRNSDVIKKILDQIISDKKFYGEKILIIVPPGNNLYSDINDYLNLKGGSKNKSVARHSELGADNDAADLAFRNDPNVRFCVVVYKNGVGWDFPDLDSVLDMTLTQNSSLIAQRSFRACRISKEKPKKKPRYVYFSPSGEDSDRSILILNRTHWLMSKEGLRMDESLVPHDSKFFEKSIETYNETGQLTLTHDSLKDVETRSILAEIKKSMTKSMKKGDLLVTWTDEAVGFVPSAIIGSKEKAKEQIANFWGLVVRKYKPNFESVRLKMIRESKKDKKLKSKINELMVQSLKKEFNKFITRHSVLTPELQIKIEDTARKWCGLKTSYEESVGRRE
jgi:superfamily II DNA or RNA helicase